MEAGRLRTRVESGSALTVISACQLAAISYNTQLHMMTITLYTLQVWAKYKHKIFYEAAKTPPLSEEQLCTEGRRIATAAAAQSLKTRVPTPAKLTS